MRLFKPGGIEALNGVSAERIAEILHVHITTARRYKRGEESSQTALEMIQLRETGALGVVDLKWAGWRLRDGLLVSDDGAYFTPGGSQGDSVHADANPELSARSTARPSGGLGGRKMESRPRADGTESNRLI